MCATALASRCERADLQIGSQLGDSEPDSQQPLPAPKPSQASSGKAARGKAGARPLETCMEPRRPVGWLKWLGFGRLARDFGRALLFQVELANKQVERGLPGLSSIRILRGCDPALDWARQTSRIARNAIERRERDFVCTLKAVQHRLKPSVQRRCQRAQTATRTVGPGAPEATRRTQLALASASERRSHAKWGPQRPHSNGKCRSMAAWIAALGWLRRRPMLACARQHRTASEFANTNEARSLARSRLVRHDDCRTKLAPNSSRLELATFVSRRKQRREGPPLLRLIVEPSWLDPSPSGTTWKANSFFQFSGGSSKTVPRLNFISVSSSVRVMLRQRASILLLLLLLFSFLFIALTS